MDGIGVIAAVGLVVVGALALLFWDGSEWLSPGASLDERLRRGEITLQQYRAIQRALAGGV
ncbi:MAG TPA: hypothetical protein VFM93_14095 [Candidatus Limnocylindria bacterium]|nr:hypothetical protein [Candidatus Limnocylindria bacterium]